MAVLTPQEASRTWTADDVMVTEPSVIQRAIGAAAIGNITEWYDFGVYAYFEPTIKEVFFADLADTDGTIATFGLFAVAFLVRPVRRPVLRAARRPDRPQQGAGHHDDPDGAGHVRHRLHPEPTRSASSRRSCCWSPGWCRASRPAASTATR